MRTIHTGDRPDEFALCIVSGRIIDAQWRDNITATTNPDTGETIGFTADVHSVERISVAATKGEAKRLLMLCRYHDPSAEVALMRREADDPERITHEAYHDRVCEYVDGIINEASAEYEE